MSPRLTSVSPEWRPDELLDGHECLVLPLAGLTPADSETCAPDDFTATLVRRHPNRHDKAVLYVHGWADYYFQTHLADFFDSIGFDFYAVDLRRYGRSWREGMLHGYIDDMGDYAREIQAALDVIRPAHGSVALMGHSTGGLITSLFVADHPGAVDALLLNSPWIDLQSSGAVGVAMRAVLPSLSSHGPTRVIPMPAGGNYIRTIHCDDEGEWSFERRFKDSPDWSVRVAWLLAVLSGHARVAEGLDIDVPVMLATSERSYLSKKWLPLAAAADTVLDVDRIRRRATCLGPCVTMVSIPGGLHDLALSAPPVRGRYFDEIARWIGAYLP